MRIIWVRGRVAITRESEEDREALGLQEENLDDAVARAVQAGEAPPVFKK